jgi:prolyl-tRNA synthetase
MLLGKTLRQPPSDAHLPSHQLLARAGYVRDLEAGLVAYLPLGERALGRLQDLVRRELEPSGGQRVRIPLLPEAEPSQALVRVVRREVDSYRQLPIVLYQHRSQTMSQPRVRAGLFGVTERLVTEIHALDGADMGEVQQRVGEALDRILGACEVEFLLAQAGDAGRSGSSPRKAYFVHPAGDEEVARCPNCSYASERNRASTKWPEAADGEEFLPEEVETPGCDTIATLAEYLDIPARQTLKMVFYSVQGKVTCVVIRGDRSVDEEKLARVLGTDEYYASLEDELVGIGAVGGYASPIGLDKSRVRVVADPSVRSGRNFVSGANRPEYHIRNVNIPRDFSPGEWADMALIEPGDPCPECGSALEVEAAFALVQAGAPEPCDPEIEYLDPEGRGHSLWLATWQLDLGRLLAAVAESHHDDYGLLWPPVCAPFDVHIVILDARKEQVSAQAEELYGRLQAEGWRVLYDGRNASAGVKFNDADLLGVPLRLTVSKRSVKEGLIEAKWRNSRERLKLDGEGLAAELGRLR